MNVDCESIIVTPTRCVWIYLKADLLVNVMMDGKVTASSASISMNVSGRFSNNVF